MRKLLSRQEYEEMIKQFPEGYCPFCDAKEQIILGESKYWYWIANLSPYWKYHTMLITKHHVENLEDLNTQELEDFRLLYSRVSKHILSLKLKQESGLLVDQLLLMLRTRYDIGETGSSYYKTPHLHFHIVPDKAGVNRFVIDDKAINVDISKLAF